MLLLDNVDVIFDFINIVGIFAFAISGAVAAIKYEADIFGVILIALITCSFGGIIRDLFIADLPPALLRTNIILTQAVIAGLFTYFFFPLVNKLSHPIDVFDALGLGVFAVVGANKGMNFGITPIWSIALGVITSVGGGIVRDMLLARVPVILRSEIYATPAILGGCIMVVGKLYFPDYEKLEMLLGASTCTGLRLMAIHYRWNVRE